MIFKEYRSLIICRETFSNSASNVLLDLSKTTIMFLGGYDLILKGWFRHQGRKKAMRNYLKIKIWMGEYIFEALVIRKDLAVITKEVMSPCLQGMNYDSEFKIMGRVVFFMWT